MKETSPNLGYTDRIRSWAKSKAHGGSHRSSGRAGNLLPLSNSPPPPTAPPAAAPSTVATESSNHVALKVSPAGSQDSPTTRSAAASGSNKDPGNGGGSSPIASPQVEGQRPVLDPGSDEEQKVKKNILHRFLLTARMILLHSKVNLLLVFVPIGIVVAEVPHMSPGLIFAMNAIAIIPLAGLLSHATESVARKLGDTIGALLNVTFGNAVELIIFIIALVKGEIRIVQASLLGSILANLLLILGMSFLLGGLRFREQIYNSTVTQMSACLLSLSVISLVLPTAFHASFSDTALADARSLLISRGTSVILLVVYIIYLLFQLKSHAYMYESTPQHIIDEESTPGPVSAWLDSSSSESSSSDDSDSDGSGHSRHTIGSRVKRVMRVRRRRKSSVISMDPSEMAMQTRTPSFGTADASPNLDEPPSEESSFRPNLLPHIMLTDGNDEAVDDEKFHRYRHRHRRHSARKYRKYARKEHRRLSPDPGGEQILAQTPDALGMTASSTGEPRRVDFALSNEPSQQDGTNRPFTGLRGISLRPVAKSLAPTVFVQPPEMALPPVPAGPVPRVRYGIRRTNSLPDRLNQLYRAPGVVVPVQVAAGPNPIGAAVKEPKEEDTDFMSRTSAIILLLVSTALVAVCAEFMVDSIQGLVATTDVGEIFIGLIILPIVGNAAEHVTAITVAMKNKMDLAIGVAVGSSIQIALFITPLVVILGWIMDRQMTLYFTLFETVCLFVSTFIVNFLVLDGRSNYLEGALLCATYVIISVVAYFYPNVDEASAWGA